MVVARAVQNRKAGSVITSESPSHAFRWTSYVIKVFRSLSVNYGSVY